MSILTDNAGYKYIGKPTKLEGNSYWVSDTGFVQYIDDAISVTSGFSSRVVSNLPRTNYSIGALITWAAKGQSTTNMNMVPVAASTSSISRVIYRDSSGTIDRSITVNHASITESYFTAFASLHPSGDFVSQFICAEPSPGVFNGSFTYSGFLSSVNPNSYYISKITDTLVQIGLSQYSHTSSGWNSGNTGYAYHQHSDTVNGGFKSLLTTGDALYSVACANGETPDSIGVTDLIVFHQHTLYNNPYIGRVQNLLLGYGTGWQYGRLYKINSSSIGVAMDGGSEYYIAVGMFPGNTGRWLLMRIGDFIN